MVLLRPQPLPQPGCALHSRSHVCSSLRAACSTRSCPRRPRGLPRLAYRPAHAWLFLLARALPAADCRCRSCLTGRPRRRCRRAGGTHRRSELARGTEVTGQSNGSSRGIAERHAEVRHVVVAAAVRRGGTSPVVGRDCSDGGCPARASQRSALAGQPLGARAPLPVPYLRSRQGQVS